MKKSKCSFNENGRKGIKKLFLFTVLMIFIIMLTSNLGFAQQGKTVKGTVLDKNSEPIYGVTVVEKGTQNGVITDLDGKYSIGLISDEATLIFSFIGMQSQEIAVNDKSTLSVTMNADVFNVEEVVVVGFGTQKKVNLTGAVSTVDE